MATDTVSLAEAGRIALAAQSFGRQRPPGRANWRVRHAIERMGEVHLTDAGHRGIKTLLGIDTKGRERAFSIGVGSATTTELTDDVHC